MLDSTDTKPSLRRTIVEAADRVIREHGLAGTTTREIAREAGCAEGSIYVHFEDKIDLVIAVILEGEPHFARLVELPGSAGEGTVEANLAAWADEVLALMGDNLPIFLALLGDRAVFDRFAERMHERGTGLIAAVGAAAAYVRAEQELGRIDPAADPEVVAGAIVGACRDQALRSLLGPVDRRPGTGFARELARILVAGLEPAARSRGGRR
ncbi:MAG TPA: TetR/AcrR family transcriptional regulator [Gaiellaceae bacterium]|nr:TetR/AcrR family transcriptional regulator [Gaiellaceae bacterium]